ncbi:ATP-binding protein [Erythrobacter sp. JK5]|uniref:ATP-binding protein n=1 Tax=Erythrobacter sp. JK5 TaxID=2829500 RepID=UPI001BAD8A1A|nr:ATP-binding protein [Erythrobacter sp. JK5]QUL38844.1 two-component sensor histidine kinase [Erythrobacter sp. JK5]
MRQSIPIAGIALAAVTFIALLALGIDPVIALSVLIVWAGSLMLVAVRSQEPANPVAEQPIGSDAMRKLIENSATPLLVTERNTIAIANNAARSLLGGHIIGQDSRVAFRQPEAIELFGQQGSGQAIVRGLVRRQDIWRINRQPIDRHRAVIELVNQTSEAAISRAHTDFVANASHELRTPLAAILGYVETLSESGETLDSPTAQKFLGTIMREGRRLQSLISDLMSLSRVEAEKHDLPTEVLDLGSLVGRAARDAAGPERVERIEFEEARAAQIKGDPQQLEQMVRNLVDNALKYGAADAVVKIVLDHSRDGQARLSVRDEGEGIAAEHIPHLTRRFFRTDPGRSRASGGTGLGLAIVKHIVERHRGRLDIASELGKGTEAVVRIPLVEPDDVTGNPATVPGREPEPQRLS